MFENLQSEILFAARLLLGGAFVIARPAQRPAQDLLIPMMAVGGVP
ncbi:hypothetical protein [Mesorhizobium sp. M1A.F.Ca.ET.072.01.1.1]